jgi:hypothetical protein
MRTTADLDEYMMTAHPPRPRPHRPRNATSGRYAKAVSGSEGRGR